MVDGFIMTFKFEDDCPLIDATLNIVMKKISENKFLVIWQLDWVAQICNVIECYNLTAEEDEEAHNIDIKE